MSPARRRVSRAVPAADALAAALAAVLLVAAPPEALAAPGRDAARDSTWAREEPFVVRPFSPVLDGRWIGAAAAYGPHRDGQRPGGPAPSVAQVSEDLALLAPHFALVRVYDAAGAGTTVLRAIRAGHLPVRVLLGVAIGDDDRREIEAAVLAAHAYPDLVLGLCAGNETQIEWSAHRVPAARLVAAVRELRARTRLPVTTGDDYNYWNKPGSMDLARELDFVTVHLHPLWNGSALDTATAWVARQLSDVRARHPDRAVVIGETGWATQRNATGDQGKLMKGALGEVEQALFYRTARAWVEREGVPTFFFEAFDENWKGGPDPADVEKHWGLFRADRTPKAAMIGIAN